jgi:cephalosporin hydroxylase
MEKFKKGEIVYTIENELIVPCEILKVANRDRIKDFKSTEVSRKKLFKTGVVDPSTLEFITDKKNRYPEIFACLQFEDGTKKWKLVDCIKRSPSEFINFIN